MMNRIGNRLFAGLVIALLAACGTAPSLYSAHRVQVAEEVGKVFVSAYPVVPWSEIGSKLEPKHALTTADARAMASITTQSQLSQFLSTFSTGLGVGLPSKSWSSSTSTDTAGNTVSATTTQRATGEVPAESGAASATIAQDALNADLGKAAAAIGIDGSTQLMGGTGLFQLAAVLDNQLSKGWLPRGYQANLITFQVNLQPARRDLPYDTYITLTLLPGDWSAGVSTTAHLSTDAATFPPVMIYPLVIADATETSSVARSVEVMRQAALSLSGIVGKIGLNVGGSGESDSLNAIIASDRNSLTTVGRVSDHTVRIRIGAQQQGSVRLAMVPKTQNISMVVFTRAADFANGHLDRLAVVSHVSFADAHTGAIVPAVEHASAQRERTATVRELMRRHGVRPFDIDHCGGPANLATNLARAAERSEYTYLSRCLAIEPADNRSLYQSSLEMPHDIHLPFSAADYGLTVGATTYTRLCSYDDNGECSALDAGIDAEGEKGNKRKGMRKPMPASVEYQFRRLVAALSRLQEPSLEQRMLIPLPFKKDPVMLPDHGQLALLQDGKSGAQVSLRGGTSLLTEKLEARLCIGDPVLARFLLPLSVSAVENGNTVTAIFPPLQKNSLAKPGDTLTLRIAHDRPASAQEVACNCPTVDGEVASSIHSSGTNQPGAAPACRAYAVSLVPDEKPDPRNPLKVTASVLVAERTGTARVAVTPGSAKDVSVRLEGAELRSGVPELPFDATINAYKLPAGVVTILNLGNLASSQNVSLYGLSGTEVVGAPIVLPVQIANGDSTP